jgi:hypothetical protein
LCSLVNDLGNTAATAPGITLLLQDHSSEILRFACCDTRQPRFLSMAYYVRPANEDLARASDDVEVRREDDAAGNRRAHRGGIAAEFGERGNLLELGSIGRRAICDLG